MENISKLFFHFNRSSTKITEFDNIKFSKGIPNGVWREFLEIDKGSTFSKKWILKERDFYYPFSQSMSYINVVVTKQIYFSPTFLKWWAHISDNPAGVVGGPKYY